MTATAYIESIDEQGTHDWRKRLFPSDDWTCDAYIGYRSKGTPIKLFESIDEVPLDRNVVLVASIENTQKWINNMGWKQPDNITIPAEFSNQMYTGRTITKVTLGEALAKFDLEGTPIFIKSYELKKFDPIVIQKESDKMWLYNVSLTTEVLMSEVVDFKSEYRVYVIEGEVVGVCNYAGSFHYYPDMNVVKYMVQQFKSAPKFYAMDVGILVETDLFEQTTVVVECNDGWALGNYGLSPRLYTRGLTARWRQFLEDNPVKLNING